MGADPCHTPMMVDDVVADRLTQITEEARSCVIPLFTSKGRGRGFLPAGSAVLIERADGLRLGVTAGHVLDGLAGLPLLTLGTQATGLIQLRYDTSLTSQPPRPNRHNDRVDLAAFPIGDDLAAKLLTKGALFFSAARIRHDWNARGIYVAIGFPHKLNKVKRRRTEPFPSEDKQASKTRKTPPYVIPNVAVLAPCTAASDERYAEVDADLELNFVAAFRHQDLQDTTGRPYPHPRGMSGGAVFRIGTDDVLVRAGEIELAGIGTEYHDTRGLLVAASAPALRILLQALGDGTTTA